ncbi:MAG: type II toxin-antitoxin system HipA family toxin [Thiolinea sp.]
MSLQPVKKLEVWRTLSKGQKVLVGILAQNRQGVFFQYDATYLEHYTNLSPFSLQHDRSLQKAPRTPHNHLHGVFADSLPDGWGLLLQDRVFRRYGMTPGQITAMDRLAFVGHSGMGALSYHPASEYADPVTGWPDIHRLGLEAQALFDGQTEQVFSALIAAGSSGGARPKAQVFFRGDDFSQCQTGLHEQDSAWLVKFTSQRLALGHEEGICEAVYLTLAAKAGIEVPTWRLLDAPGSSGADYWLALKRFDWQQGQGHPAQHGRLHMHSACGLLDADFQSPSLDYEDLIKASRVLCRSALAGKVQFRRAIFNLLACNQDDHSKNWAFLQNDDGQWTVAPFYDVTFSPHPFGEHATAFSGYGKQPPLKAMKNLAQAAGFANWSEARVVIERVQEAVSTFREEALLLGVKKDTVRLIEKQLNATWMASREALLGD